MNKRYMSLYGYPIKTTPFLDSINGLFLTNYISSAPNTTTSLPRTLCVTDKFKNILYAENIVSLSNQAGLNTYWISNQGKLGKHDFDISKIASKCKYVYFTKKGAFDIENIDDNVLLPKVKNIIQTDKNNKIVFIHLMGSHPDPCERLHNEPINFKTNINNTLDCYLATYYKTDKFISQIYDYLEKSAGSFSLMYFSDHGMTITNSKPYIHHGNNTKENYEVPFLILSSNDTERKIIDKNVSAFNFIDIFADWIGVQTNFTKDDFSIENCDSNGNIKVFNWENIIEYNTLPDTPILLPKS